MLSTKGLAEVLSQNTDPKLCRRWWLMTSNGTLLAYSQPADIKDLRKQAAMIILSWQEHEAERGTADSMDDEPPGLSVSEGLTALTVESEAANTIAVKLHPQLLLVLEGGVPPRRQGFEPKTTAEGTEDETYPPDNMDATHLSKNATISSRASSITSNAATSVLRLQRKKVDAMANVIADDLERTGFQMPEEGSAKFF